MTYLNLNSIPDGEFQGHKWGISTSLEERKIFQTCTCGWKGQIRLIPSLYSKYADSSMWASHFNFDRQTAPFL